MTLSYARRQQRRRLTTAVSRAAGAVVALGGAVLAAGAGETQVGLLLALLAGVLALASRHAVRLAGRSRVGADSEAQVQQALDPLERGGWSVRHAADWPGRGDLDHVVRSPRGMGFVIETKTLRYSRAHVVRTVDAARWLAGRRRRYPRGVVPVVCVTRARHVERAQDGALVVSLDRLLDALNAAAGAPAANAPAMARGRMAHRDDPANGQRNLPAELMLRSSVR